TTGIASGIGAVPTLRAELRLPTGLAIVADVSSKHATRFSETSGDLLVGYRRGVWFGDRFGAWLGGEAGAGLVVQTIAAHAAAYSGGAIIPPSAGLLARIAGGVSLGLDGSVPLALLRRDNATAVVALPALWAMVSFDL